MPRAHRSLSTLRRSKPGCLLELDPSGSTASYCSSGENLCALISRVLRGKAAGSSGKNLVTLLLILHWYCTPEPGHQGRRLAARHRGTDHCTSPRSHRRFSEERPHPAHRVGPLGILTRSPGRRQSCSGNGPRAGRDGAAPWVSCPVGAEGVLACYLSPINHGQQRGTVTRPSRKLWPLTTLRAQSPVTDTKVAKLRKSGRRKNRAYAPKGCMKLSKSPT